MTAARAEVVRAGTASGAGRLPAVLRAAAPGVLAAAAASVAVFGDGGFAPSARVAFAAVAALALVAAFACEPSEAARLIRSPVVVVLLALAALAAVSAVWTVASPGASFRWAAVTAGYAGVTVAAAVAARRHGPAPLAVLVCVLAAATAAIGLAAAAAFQLPYAERIGGAWRPGGSFEYPPALALAQVCALPAQLSGMCSRRAWLAGPAALAAAGAAAVLALADSRTALMLAAATASVGLAVHGGERRAKLGAALALTLGAGVAAQLVAGGFVPRGHSSPDTARGLSLAAICSLAPVCWLAIRSALARIAPSAGSRTVSPLRAATLASALAAAALAVGTAVFTEPSGSAAETSGGFAHGRAHTWRAALDTWGDRPIAGAGADAFLTASARHRHDGVRFAHDLPLELAAELGVAGLALALALYATAGRALWLARRTTAAWLLGPAVVAFLAANLVDWPWHLAGSGALFALAVGGVLGAAAERAPPAGASQRCSMSISVFPS